MMEKVDLKYAIQAVTLFLDEQETYVNTYHDAFCFQRRKVYIQYLTLWFILWSLIVMSLILFAGLDSVVSGVFDIILFIVGCFVIVTSRQRIALTTQKRMKPILTPCQYFDAQWAKLYADLSEYLYGELNERLQQTHDEMLNSNQGEATPTFIQMEQMMNETCFAYARKQAIVRDFQIGMRELLLEDMDAEDVVDEGMVFRQMIFDLRHKKRVLSRSQTDKALLMYLAKIIEENIQKIKSLQQQAQMIVDLKNPHTQALPESLRLKVTQYENKAQTYYEETVQLICDTIEVCDEHTNSIDTNASFKRTLNAYRK